MGRGSSKAVGGKIAAPKGTTTITVGNDTIDLSDSPLIYGGNDPYVTGKARTAIEEWEDKRIKNKIEYNITVDQDGDIIGKENRGGKGTVRVPLMDLQSGGVHSHIHPRGEGLLGGTFSEKDMLIFADNNVSTYRAKAKEGAYSISKAKGFDKQGFKSYMNDINSKFDKDLKSKINAINNKIQTDKSYSYEQYCKEFNKIANGCLVTLHNDMIAGQKKYGYSYTLEGGK